MYPIFPISAFGIIKVYVRYRYRSEAQIVHRLFVKNDNI